MTHPLTPPEELLEHWDTVSKLGNGRNALTLAYRAGADQELEACCHEVQDMYSGGSRLRAARRPKPPSLKEQALGALGRFNTNAHMAASEMMTDFDTIRRALEALDD
jgi:hypothetical protein